MKEIYETDVYADRNPNWHEEDAPWKAKQIERILRKNEINFDTLCEVGCGTGEILLNLAKVYPGVQFSGFEIAPHAYQRAKSKQTNAVVFQFENLLDDPDATFDVVLVADVIEHVEDYISFIKGLKSHGKYKIFHIPLDLSVQSVLRSTPITRQRADVGHLHYFFKDTALATLTDCGYSIVDYCYTASRLELPNQAISSQFMRFPRRAFFKMNPDLAVRVLGGYSLLVLAQ